VKKLLENFACFQDKLGDELVFGAFCHVLEKSRKFAKPELREALDDLEAKVFARRLQCSVMY
jgi:condensin complex subunit 1